MAGSQPATETSNGKAVVHSGDRLRRFFVLGGLIAAAALAACSTPVPAPAPVAVAPAATSDTAALPESPPAPAEPAAMHIPELPALTGMGPGELVALLGEPDLRRRESPAELWQYRSADCVLDVFLYADRVVRSATRNPHVAPPVIAACAAPFDRRSRESRL